MYEYHPVRFETLTGSFTDPVLFIIIFFQSCKSIGMKKTLLTSVLPCLFTYAFSQTANVGIGTLTPARAKLEVHGVSGEGKTSGIFGGDGAGLSLQRDWPTIGFNQYRDNSAGYGKYLSNGFAGIQHLDPSTGLMSFDFFPSGSANTEAASTTRAMQLSYLGNVGIKGASPNSELQLSNTHNNRKITLWEAVNNPYQYLGFGIQPFSLTYNVSGPSDRHLFLSAASSSSAKQLMEIHGNGNISVGGDLTVDDANRGKLGINTLPWAPQTALEVNGAISMRTKVITVVSNTTITVGDCSYITIDSGGQLATSIHLTDGTTPGQLLFLQGTPTSNVYTWGSNMNISGDQNGKHIQNNNVLFLFWTGSVWVELGYR